MTQLAHRDWDGNERRKEERATLYEQVGELRVRVAHIETSLTKLDKISAQMDTFMKQGQGVAQLLKILFYVIGPVVGALYWVKEHVR